LFPIASLGVETSRTRHVVDSFARPEQRFTASADHWQRVAGGDVVHHGIKNGDCRYRQVPGTQLGYVYLPDLFPAPAIGASPRCLDCLSARVPEALPLFPHLSEVTDLDSGVIETMPRNLGARTGA
jgi:hypothetical protein